jgi:hypothetical protein
LGDSGLLVGEAALQQGAGLGSALLACLLLPALALALHRGTPLGWVPLLAAAEALALAGAFFLGALDKRVRRRRMVLACRPQIAAYLRRTGLSPDDFRRHAAETAGPESLLVRCLAAAARRDRVSSRR